MERKVLIVDDAMFARTMLSQIMAKGGYQVVGEAVNGREAVEKYDALQPDLVTMDVVMPEMNGIEALRAILGKDPQARVLMCSAMGQERLVEEALQAGAKGFLVKPLNVQRVLAVLQETLS